MPRQGITVAEHQVLPRGGAAYAGAGAAHATAGRSVSVVCTGCGARRAFLAAADFLGDVKCGVAKRLGGGGGRATLP